MFCRSCGKEMNTDESFCSSCGNKVITSSLDASVQSVITKTKQITKKQYVVIGVCVLIVVALLIGVFGGNKYEKALRGDWITEDEHYTIEYKRNGDYAQLKGEDFIMGQYAVNGDKVSVTTSRRIIGEKHSDYITSTDFKINIFTKDKIILTEIEHGRELVLLRN